jgi:ubiquinone biosynthesis protein Coq4
MIPVYQFLRKSKKPWEVTQAELADYPTGSLGKAVSDFLEENQLTLIPRAEFHDVYHVLFGFSTSMEDETAIQFLGVGNGRYSIPWLASCGLAFVFYPERWGKFYRAFMQGRRAETFHHINWEKLLEVKVKDLRKDLQVVA